MICEYVVELSTELDWVCHGWCTKTFLSWPIWYQLLIFCGLGEKYHRLFYLYQFDTGILWKTPPKQISLCRRKSKHKDLAYTTISAAKAKPLTTSIPQWNAELICFGGILNRELSKLIRLVENKAHKETLILTITTSPAQKVWPYHWQSGRKSYFHQN